jgi:hypothetical protein
MQHVQQVTEVLCHGKGWTGHVQGTILWFSSPDNLHHLLTVYKQGKAVWLIIAYFGLLALNLAALEFKQPNTFCLREGTS